MPVHETEGGYQYGKTGKVYKSKKKAIKQAIAIAYSKAREKGRKPKKEEIEVEISGNPDKENMNKVANALRKLAEAYRTNPPRVTVPPKRAPEFPNMPTPKGGWTGPEAVNPPTQKKPTPEKPVQKKPSEKEQFERWKKNFQRGGILEIKNGQYVTK